MTPGEFKFVREVFEEALAKGGAEREAVLDRAGPSGHPTRCRIESLLRDAQTGETFLGAPVVPPSAAMAVAESAMVAEQDLLVGRRVGRYQVVRLIGSGGMGNVYEAQQEQPRRQVALKVIHPALAGRSSLRRFEYESAVLARLRHPGIAQVYEAGTAQVELDGRPMLIPFIAMEYLADAQPITSYALRRRLTQAQRLELLAQVCDAVHHGHQRGVIHRDLKPANILVEPSGAPRVVDFGIARAAEADTASVSTRSLAGQIVGTLAYMPPEQFGADAREVDTRADVYALGAVLFEMLTGVTPHDVSGRAIAEAARIVHDQPPRRLSALDPSLRGDLETIVDRALASDRAMRYASASQLGEDLRRYLRSEPIAARPPSARYQARLFARRNKALVGAAGAIALVLALAAVATSALAIFATRQARAAEEARQVATAERDHAVRVASFLEGALSSANPRIANVSPAALASEYDPFAEFRTTPWPYVGKPGRKATVPDLLIAAAERLDQAFPEDPGTRARLATALGRTLFSLTDDEVDVEASRRVLQQAFDAALKAHGDDHETTIRAALFLGDALGHTGPVGANRPLFERAVAAAERVFGRLDPRTLRAYRTYAANIHLWEQDHRQAAALLKRALDAAAAAGVSARPPVLELQAQYAYFLAWAGDGDEAERIGLEALESMRRVAGVDTPFVGDSAQSLAGVYRLRGKHDESVECLLAAIESYTRSFGEGSWRVVGAWADIGRARAAQERWAEAEDAYRRSLEISRPLLGLQKWDTWTTVANLVSALHRQEKYGAETERLAREAIAGYAQHRVGDPDPGGAALTEQWVLFFERVIAESAFAQGRRTEGEALMREQLTRADAREHLAAHRPAIRYRLASWLIVDRRLDEAEALLEQSEALFRERDLVGSVQWREYEAVRGRLAAARDRR